MYFGLMMACADDTCGLPNGQTPDLYLFGTTLVTICVLVTNLKVVSYTGVVEAFVYHILKIFH